MPLVSSIQDGFSYIKKTISIKAQSLWHHYYVQAPYQGLTAPIYNYSSVKNILHASEDAHNEFFDTIKLNGIYAAKALLGYFIYHRFIHPFLEVSTEDNETLQWMFLRWGAMGADFAIKTSLDLYLYWEQLYVLSQNLSYAADLPTTAAEIMSEDEKKNPTQVKNFLPCSCSNVDKTIAEGYSLFIYLGLRWVADKSANFTQNVLPQAVAGPASFMISSFCFGYPLVEYKLSAVGNCFTHRFIELYKGNKTYVMAFGAAFVMPYWLLNYATTQLTSAENNFFYDAEFNLLFQLYALLSVARITPFPGGPHPSFDILGFLKKIWASPPFQAGFHLFEERYAPKNFVQHRGTSNSIAKREKKIRHLLTTMNVGLENAKSFNESNLLAWIEWGLKMLKCLPKREVRQQAKEAFKKILNTLIASNDYLLEILEIALLADAAHRTSRNVNSIQEQIQPIDRFNGETPTPVILAEKIKPQDTKKAVPAIATQMMEVVNITKPKSEEKFKITNEDHFDCNNKLQRIDDDWEIIKPSMYVSQVNLFPRRNEHGIKSHKSKFLITRALKKVSM